MHNPASANLGMTFPSRAGGVAASAIDSGSDAFASMRLRLSE